MSSRTLGIDLAVRAQHVGALADASGELCWRRERFRTCPEDLDRVLERAGGADGLTVVIEPTRNAWVPVAAYFVGAGTRVVLVSTERAADLRRYYSRHAKTDRLDAAVLARLPLLHPEGLCTLDGLGPADPLKRAVRRRVRLVEAHVGSCQRLDAMLDLLGPAYAEAFGHTCFRKTALDVLERYGNPYSLRRLGLRRLTEFIRRQSRGAWKQDHAHALLAAADEAIRLWSGGGLDFDELAWDLTSEIRVLRGYDTEIARLEERIADLYAKADPQGIVASAPGVAAILSGGILGRLGDANRFATLAGVRAFSGMLPATNQSGNTQTRPGITKAGDPGLRRDIFIAAEQARRLDPQLAAKYYRLIVERGLHHNSAVCHIATTLLTRIAACWRRNERYVIRDVDGRRVTTAEARAIIARRYKVPAQARQRTRTRQNERASRHKKESTEIAPAPARPKNLSTQPSP